MSDEAFRESVRAALASPVGAPLAERFPARLVTALVAGSEPGELDRLAVALEEVSAALHAVGRSGEARRTGHSGAATAYAALAVAMFALFAAAVVFGVHIMLSKG